jgi:hypothetical protein
MYVMSRLTMRTTRSPCNPYCLLAGKGAFVSIDASHFQGKSMHTYVMSRLTMLTTRPSGDEQVKVVAENVMDGGTMQCLCLTRLVSNHF